MKKLFKQISTIMLATALAVTSTVTPVLAASDRVLMSSPAKDAAFVLDMPGFQNVSYKNLLDKAESLNEGLVIRESRIENGKIIIPPSGLYYTTRTGTADMLTGHKVLILGKEYSIVDTKTKFDVISDVDIEKGKGYPLGDGTKRLNLTSIGIDSNGFEGPTAKFEILKPSGNFYGAAFPVSPNAKMINVNNGVINKGTGRTTGTYSPGVDGQNFHVEYYGNNVAISGQSYLAVSETTAKGAHVDEFGTGAIVEYFLSPNAPVEMLLGKGESKVVGDYTVNVIDLTANSATVELKDKDGKVATKVLGSLNEQEYKYLPADEITRNKLVMKSEKQDVQIQVDVFREPFREGKVALVGYTDVVSLQNPDKWSSDPRFIARPDT